MNKMEILANAFDFIEQNLQYDIKTQEIAEACYCSKTVLEKMFRCIGHIGVHEYVVKRKMMLAARIITLNTSMNMLDIALACGYSTNESFSRAFKKVWNTNPSEFKSRKKFSELFPRFYPPIYDGGAYMNMQKDISELYDLFVQRRNCYFVCCDIRSLVPINEISHKAGDLAIIEAMNRMQREAGKEDIVFRIGGDEFVILTNRQDKQYAEDISEKIRKYNGQSIMFEDKEIPLSLHIATAKFDGENLRYKDLYEKLHIAINENKKKNR